jgi:transcription antitermination factor NusG
MTSIRHQDRVARLRAGAFTKQQREAIGLPPHPVRRHTEPPAFPANPGEYVWFALTTTKQGESKAVLELARAGFAAFNPTEVVMARASRIVKFKRQERERALLTGIVLVGFPGRRIERRRGNEVVSALYAEVPWLRVFDAQHVVGVVGMGEGPVSVPLGNVMNIRMQHRRKAGTRSWTATVGETVEVTFGAWSGKMGEIVQLADGAAMVMLFGATGVLQNLAGPLTVPEAWVRGVA